MEYIKSPDNPIRLLYIDPFSSEGHINFNNIFIGALYNEISSIDFVFRDGYKEKLHTFKNSKNYAIPNKFYSKTKNKFQTRLGLFRIYNYLKKIISENQYDFILFSSYDELTLHLSCFRKGLILINHNNLYKLDRSLKFYFFKKSAKDNYNIVFENYMKDYLNSKGINNVYVIHHGLPISFDVKIMLKASCYNEFSSFDKYKKIIFSPSGSSMDITFINNLIKNKSFLTFLENNEILLILKNKYTKSSHTNIHVISNYLSISQYQYLFLKSNMILISYPLSFKLRVSAVLFEAISNKKLCLISDIPSLKNFKNFFKYDPYFSNVDTLIERINLIINLPDHIRIDPYKNTDLLSPDFKILFKDIKKLLT